MFRLLVPPLLMGCLTCVVAEASEPLEVPAQDVVSSYVTMRDATRLAVDVWLPRDREAKRVPAILQLTRYWRAGRQTGRPPLEEAPSVIDYFTAEGYAVVVVDVRGTGASFGARISEFSDVEVQDAGEIIDWIASQPWSNGRVATLGTSYSGNAGELAAIPVRPALRAVVPRFTDFSEYRHAVRPGGIRNSAIAQAWVGFVQALDRNDGCGAFAAGMACDSDAPWSEGVKPVDADRDGSMLAAALKEHSRSVDLRRIVAGLVYSDDPFADRAGVTLESVSPSARWQAIDRAGIPAYHWASWYDGGTAEGVLERFATYRSPLKVVIGAWTHGGGQDANPYRQGGVTTAPQPAPATQMEMIREFLQPLMRGEATAEPELGSEITYFTLGADEWRTTRTWPPRGTVKRNWYLHDGHRLRPDPSLPAEGSDGYDVDFSASTGLQNRWHTQLGSPVNYAAASDAGTRRLTYTSDPLSRPTEITGTPVADLWISTSATDGTIFAYLEDVAPGGTVTYLTEGQQRLLFPADRESSTRQCAQRGVGSYSRGRAEPPVPGQLRRYCFNLHPISVVLPPGHRLRLALTGADAGTFELLPAVGPPPRLTVARDRSGPSLLVLPGRD